MKFGIVQEYKKLYKNTNWLSQSLIFLSLTSGKTIEIANWENFIPTLKNKKLSFLGFIDAWSNVTDLYLKSVNNKTISVWLSFTYGIFHALAYKINYIYNQTIKFPDLYNSIFITFSYSRNRNFLIASSFTIESQSLGTPSS